MKYGVSRLTDVSSLASELAAAGVRSGEAFLDYMTDFTEETIRALQRQLTLEDNIASTVKTVTLKEGVVQTVSYDTPRTPVHVIPTKVTPFSTAILSFNWQLTLEGKLEVRASFLGAPTTTQTVTIVILY